MPKYNVNDDQVTLEVEADSMREAAETWADGDWGEGKVLIDVRVVELDGEGNETDSVEHFSIEVGDDPEPPECTSGEHDWRSPYGCVGGLKENPGVWSMGGTTMKYLECCKNCGIYKSETRYGSQRNPGQCDKIEYLPADDESLEWASSLPGRSNS